MSKNTEQERISKFANSMYFNNMDDVRRCLTEDPAIVHSLNQHGTSWLIRAVEDGNLTAVKLLMEFNPDTTLQNEKGETAVYIAARDGRTDIIGTILEKDPRALNIVNARGWSPLMEVTGQGRQETVNEILKYEPDLDIKTKSSGGTVFTIAETRGYTHTPILRALNEAKARQEAKQSGNDVIVQVASSEEGKDQKPSSDLPLPASAPNIESKEVSASQPPVTPQTQIVQVSSDTTMQPAQKSTERG